MAEFIMNDIVIIVVFVQNKSSKVQKYNRIVKVHIYNIPVLLKTVNFGM